jgi:hypothetical protein
MWLFFLVAPLAIFLIVGGLLAGGIYTIVFLPIAVIIAVGSIIYTMWGSSTEPRNIPGERGAREAAASHPASGHGSGADDS